MVTLVTLQKKKKNIYILLIKFIHLLDPPKLSYCYLFKNPKVTMVTIPLPNVTTVTNVTFV